jgi:hypothetical protein
MKGKVLATLLVLNLLVVFVLPVPVRAESLTLEPVQGIVGSDVKVPAFCQYGTGDYFLYWGEGNQLITQGTVTTGGCQPITFKVPQAARGKHTVTLKFGTRTFQKDFTVLASISLGVRKGTVGSAVSIQGNGFDAREAGIKILYDSNAAASSIEANSNGSWLYSLKIPASSRGDHPVSASGSTTPAAEVGNQKFNVTPSIGINPNSGWVGRVVNISGYGFASAETNVTVTYDNFAVKTNLTADLTGSWQTTFTVPASSKGMHKVDARGATTLIDDVPDTSFTVSPGIKVEQASGRLGETISVGDQLFISGVGFQENETNIRVTYDNMQVAGSIQADAQGSWTAQFEVPPSIRGDHKVNSFGDTTRQEDVTGYTVIITPEININPNSGAVGENTILTGTGFGASQPLTVTYNATRVATGATTDAKGSFSTTFKPPASSSGSHLVAVSDLTQALASTSFTIEATAPPAPKQVSPEAGAKFGMFDNKPIDFKWTAVEDPSGVKYAFEMSNKADFSGTLLRKENLDKPEITLAGNERPGSGEYYWRVKAIDNAGNPSDWSSGQLLMIGGLDFLFWPVVIGIAVLAVVLLVVWRIRAISKSGGWSSSSSA